MTLEEAMRLVPTEKFLRWQLDAAARPASDYLNENLRRLTSFDLQTTEQAKTLLMDALFGEIVPHYAMLKVWKAAALETDTLKGVADYLITPKREYIATPLLCVAEAKRDDFVQGRAQCIAQLTACAWESRQRNHETTVHGIVSNGQDWQSYKLTTANKVWEADPYSLRHLPELLDALDYICGECARSVPAQSGA